MQRNAERFLTTHTGSLPRPDDLIRTMFAKEEAVLASTGPRSPSACARPWRTSSPGRSRRASTW